MIRKLTVRNDRATERFPRAAPAPRRPLGNLFSVFIFFLALGPAANLRAQIYNPNNYDTALIMQEMRHPHSDNVMVAAHRGTHSTPENAAYYAENSLEAIRDTALNGGEMVEVDIKLSADLVPMWSRQNRFRSWLLRNR
jgi:hypothetical protein